MRAHVQHNPLDEKLRLFHRTLIGAALLLGLILLGVQLARAA